MTTTRITTNNVPRDLIDGYQLTPAEREEFDYIDWDAIEEGTDSATFVRYKGELINLGDVQRVSPTIPADSFLRGWDGFRSDSFFSGILIRFVDGNDSEGVVVATYNS